MNANWRCKREILEIICACWMRCKRAGEWFAFLNQMICWRQIKIQSIHLYCLPFAIFTFANGSFDLWLHVWRFVSSPKGKNVATAVLRFWIVTSHRDWLSNRNATIFSMSILYEDTHSSKNNNKKERRNVPLKIIKRKKAFRWYLIELAHDWMCN